MQIRTKRMVVASVKEKFITGQNEREETTQDAIVTKSAAFASYEINYVSSGQFDHSRIRGPRRGGRCSEGLN